MNLIDFLFKINYIYFSDTLPNLLLGLSVFSSYWARFRPEPFESLVPVHQGRATIFNLTGGVITPLYYLISQ